MFTTHVCISHDETPAGSGDIPTPVLLPALGLLLVDRRRQAVLGRTNILHIYVMCMYTHRHRRPGRIWLRPRAIGCPTVPTPAGAGVGGADAAARPPHPSSADRGWERGLPLKGDGRNEEKTARSQVRTREIAAPVVFDQNLQIKCNFSFIWGVVDQNTSRRGGGTRGSMACFVERKKHRRDSL